MSRVLINGQDVNMTDGFPEMNYAEWKALPKELRPDFTIIKDRNYTGEPIDISVSVTADGVKTYGELLTELSALVDYSKVTRNSKIILGNMIHPVTSITSGDVRFSVSTQHTQNRYYSQTIHLNLAKFYLYDIQNGTPTGYDFTNNVPTSGNVITLYYNIVSSGGGDTFSVVGSATGTTEIALPDGWQEIVADVEPNNQRSDSITFTVCKAQLRSGSKTFKQSFYMSSSYYFLVQITVTASTIKMSQVNISGTDKISASTLRVYSR